MKNKNLTGYVGFLHDKEVGFIVRVVNTYGGLATPVHRGSVMFTKYDLVIKCLRNSTEAVSASSDVEIRYAKRLLNKLGVENSSETVTFQMFLSTKKLSRLAAYSSTNKPMTIAMKVPFTVTREVGLQWQEFGKKWVSPEVNVNHFLEIRKVRGNLYEVVAPKKLESKVKEFLHSSYAEEV